MMTMSEYTWEYQEQYKWPHPDDLDRIYLVLVERKVFHEPFSSHMVEPS